MRQNDLLYPCYCSRREVREAAAAPHVHLPDGAYPGTCLNLSDAERAERAESRPAAWRVRTGNVEITFTDENYGEQTELVDDFVIQRNDGVASYNLATVLDDADQGVTEVVRGADLLPGTARHVWLRRQLGLRPVAHDHVPLVLNTEGDRLAKRDGAVTLGDLSSEEHGNLDAAAVRSMLAVGLGLAEPDEPVAMSDLLARYNPSALSLEPTVWEF